MQLNVAQMIQSSSAIAGSLSVVLVLVSALSIPFFTCTACQRLIGPGLEMPSTYVFDVACKLYLSLMVHTRLLTYEFALP